MVELLNKRQQVIVVKERKKINMHQIFDYEKASEINPKAGQVVFFLSSAYHSVPTCSVDGRCSVVGNIMYIDKSYIRV